MEILRKTVVSLVRSDLPDLTARQLAVFLICYLEQEATQTVRGMASKLKVSKSVIARALMQLEKFKLARRTPEPGDRRSIVVVFTPEGGVYMRGLVRTLGDAAAIVEAQAGQRPTE